MARGGKRKGAGAKKGSTQKRTLEKEAVLKAYRERVHKNADVLFNSQMSLARGVAYLYRIEETAKGGKEHVLVSNPDEIGDILAQMDGEEMDSGVFNDQYYYITVKAPDNKAIDSMLNRTFGSPTQMVEIKEPPKKDDNKKTTMEIWNEEFTEFIRAKNRGT